jgi:hypothetical protein
VNEIGKQVAQEILYNLKQALEEQIHLIQWHQ